VGVVSVFESTGAFRRQTVLLRARERAREEAECIVHEATMADEKEAAPPSRHPANEVVRMRVGDTQVVAVIGSEADAASLPEVWETIRRIASEAP
jgi:hypothetical protein